jgi:serine/threonine-protein phosphatase 2A regulatory subunit B'
MTPEQLEQARVSVTEQLANTPPMREGTPETLIALFTKKLELCCVRFSFADPTTHAQGKELKRTTLLELVDFVHTDEGQQVLSLGDVVASAMKMVTANVFRPPPTGTFELYA